MKVRWSANAEESLADILAHFRRFSERSANDWGRRLVRRAESAATFPWSFREVPEIGSPNVRETFEQEYRIWFEIRGDEIEILVVFHGARDV